MVQTALDPVVRWFLPDLDGLGKFREFNFPPIDCIYTDTEKVRKFNVGSAELSQFPGLIRHFWVV
jgi:hypothetical protein